MRRKIVFLVLICSTLITAATITDLTSLFGKDGTKEDITKVQAELFPFLNLNTSKVRNGKIVKIDLMILQPNKNERVNQENLRSLELQVLKKFGKPDSTEVKSRYTYKHWFLATGDTLSIDIGRRIFEEDSVRYISHIGLRVQNSRFETKMIGAAMQASRKKYKRESVKGTRPFENFRQTTNLHKKHLLKIYYDYMTTRYRENDYYLVKGSKWIRFHVNPQGKQVFLEELSTDFPKELDSLLLDYLKEIKFTPISSVEDTSTYRYGVHLTPNKIIYYKERYLNQK